MPSVFAETLKKILELKKTEGFFPRDIEIESRILKHAINSTENIGFLVETILDKEKHKHTKYRLNAPQELMNTALAKFNLNDFYQVLLRSKEEEINQLSLKFDCRRKLKVSADITQDIIYLTMCILTLNKRESPQDEVWISLNEINNKMKTLVRTDGMKITQLVKRKLISQAASLVKYGLVKQRPGTEVVKLLFGEDLIQSLFEQVEPGLYSLYKEIFPQDAPAPVMEAEVLMKAPVNSNIQTPFTSYGQINKILIKPINIQQEEKSVLPPIEPEQQSQKRKLEISATEDETSSETTMRNSKWSKT